MLQMKTLKKYLNLMHIHGHLHRILITGNFGSWKKDALLNLMGRQPAIAKTYLHAKDPYHAKYQLLINKCKICNGLKTLQSFQRFHRIFYWYG